MTVPTTSYEASGLGSPWGEIWKRGSVDHPNASPTSLPSAPGTVARSSPDLRISQDI